MYAPKLDDPELESALEVSVVDELEVEESEFDKEE